MLTGTLVTLVASIVPALRATRVPPISAVREGSSATTAGRPASAAAAPRSIVHRRSRWPSIAARRLFGGVPASR